MPSIFFSYKAIRVRSRHWIVYRLDESENVNAIFVVYGKGAQPSAFQLRKAAYANRQVEATGACFLTVPPVARALIYQSDGCAEPVQFVSVRGG